ncbi:MAG: (2E,6E)-farnesyl diphosphate synthase [Gammaproteobacteria bacterium 28-57-27]|nr:MAG: (2E,6E)-farnesyl diphosphate synthase [Gammaproteobacteria bacterium 28-57-27]
MMQAKVLNAALKHSAARSEQVLNRLLPAADAQPSRLHQAMRYAALGAGKRVRPFLVYSVGTMLGADENQLDAPACAVELIHAYSLVHDDLPAMDDDDLRRGRPTCHRAFDEATAILVGDALQTLAFEVLTTAPDLDANTRLAMLSTLAHASGSQGMAGGQALDLAAVGMRLDLAALEHMHRLKTGALIAASVQLGALAAHASETAQAQLAHYARAIGLAFQVRDDVLDVTADSQTLGKTQGKDASDDKPTYVSLLGLDAAQALCMSLRDEAIAALDGLPMPSELLHLLAHYIVAREA